jgi:hypothetical protein
MRLAYIGTGLVALVLAIGLHARPAAAEVDATGEWTAAYSLACGASIMQTGANVTGTIDCGSDIFVGVSGTFDSVYGTLTLTGDFVGFPVTINGQIAGDGRSLNGTWSAPPIVTEGPFSALRENEPSMTDVTGIWNINVLNIFSGSCTASMEQAGESLSASVDCEGGPTGTFEGTIDPDTGAASLGGPFGQFTALEMNVNIAEDGESFTGIWRIDPTGPAGIMSGERLSSGPEEEESPTRPRSRATATPAGLPETGAGRPGSGSDWAYGAIAGALALSAASYAALRRLR